MEDLKWHFYEHFWDLATTNAVRKQRVYRFSKFNLNFGTSRHLSVVYKNI